VTDPTKFFGFELGSISKYDKDTDKAVVNGAHDTSKMFELLNKFIEMFVLCPNCKYVMCFYSKHSSMLLPCVHAMFAMS
jgi:translation initiation factor 2 beta subunit (eIF-2beta)/eIF-5